MPPLILTLQLDTKSFSFFNELRKRHFPPERNYLDAHLTLFHHLPNEKEVIEKIQLIASETLVLSLQVSSVVSIGRGVAYKIDCPPLVALHKKLQGVWKGKLTQQDSQGLWPHVTVQNKVDAGTAKALQEDLALSFEPFIAQGIGLSLFTYEGGPWSKVADYPFAG